MQLRRFEDLAVRVLVAKPPQLGGAGPTAESAVATPTLDLREYHFDLGRPALASPVAAPPAEAGPSALLVDLGDGGALFVAGPQLRRLPKATGEETLLARAVLEVEEWRRRQLGALRRSERSDRCTVLSEELSRATTRQEVVDAVLEHAGRIGGGFDSLLLRRPEPDADALEAVPNPRIPIGLAPVPLAAFQPPSAPGLIRPADVGPGSPLIALSPLFGDVGARTLAYAPLEERGVLILIERRAERAFEPDDWYFLRAVARQVEAALRRIELGDEVVALALDDPLTGAASRRRLQVTLSHAVAAARRGAPLSLLALDLTGLAAVNERDGWPAGDRALRAFTCFLSHNLRGTDTVARVGGDEFVVVLPGCNAAGAGHALDRLNEARPNGLAFSAGPAQFDHTRMTAGADLIAAAEAARRGRLAPLTTPV